MQFLCMKNIVIYAHGYEAFAQLQTQAHDNQTVGEVLKQQLNNYQINNGAIGIEIVDQNGNKLIDILSRTNNDIQNILPLLNNRSLEVDYPDCNVCVHVYTPEQYDQQLQNTNSQGKYVDLVDAINNGICDKMLPPSKTINVFFPNNNGNDAESHLIEIKDGETAYSALKRFITEQRISNGYVLMQSAKNYNILGNNDFAATTILNDLNDPEITNKMGINIIITNQQYYNQQYYGYQNLDFDFIKYMNNTFDQTLNGTIPTYPSVEEGKYIYFPAIENVGKGEGRLGWNEEENCLYYYDGKNKAPFKIRNIEKYDFHYSINAQNNHAAKESIYPGIDLETIQSKEDFQNVCKKIQERRSKIDFICKQLKIDNQKNISDFQKKMKTELMQKMKLGQTSNDVAQERTNTIINNFFSNLDNRRKPITEVIGYKVLLQTINAAYKNSHYNNRMLIRNILEMSIKENNYNDKFFFITLNINLFPEIELFSKKDKNAIDSINNDFLNIEKSLYSEKDMKDIIDRCFNKIMNSYELFIQTEAEYKKNDDKMASYNNAIEEASKKDKQKLAKKTKQKNKKKNNKLAFNMSRLSDDKDPINIKQEIVLEQLSTIEDENNNEQNEEEIDEEKQELLAESSEKFASLTKEEKIVFLKKRSDVLLKEYGEKLLELYNYIGLVFKYKIGEGNMYTNGDFHLKSSSITTRNSNDFISANGITNSDEVVKKIIAVKKKITDLQILRKHLFLNQDSPNGYLSNDFDGLNGYDDTEGKYIFTVPTIGETENNNAQIEAIKLKQIEISKNEIDIVKNWLKTARCNSADEDIQSTFQMLAAEPVMSALMMKVNGFDIENFKLTGEKINVKNNVPNILGDFLIEIALGKNKKKQGDYKGIKDYITQKKTSYNTQNYDVIQIFHNELSTSFSFAGGLSLSANDLNYYNNKTNGAYQIFANNVQTRHNAFSYWHNTQQMATCTDCCKHLNGEHRIISDSAIIKTEYNGNSNTQDLIDVYSNINPVHTSNTKCYECDEILIKHEQYTQLNSANCTTIRINDPKDKDSRKFVKFPLFIRNKDGKFAMLKAINGSNITKNGKTNKVFMSVQEDDKGYFHWSTRENKGALQDDFFLEQSDENKSSIVYNDLVYQTITQSEFLKYKDKIQNLLATRTQSASVKTKQPMQKKIDNCTIFCDMYDPEKDTFSVAENEFTTHLGLNNDLLNELKLDEEHIIDEIQNPGFKPNDGFDDQEYDNIGNPELTTGGYQQNNENPTNDFSFTNKPELVMPKNDDLDEDVVIVNVKLSRNNNLSVKIKAHYNWNIERLVNEVKQTKEYKQNFKEDDNLIIIFNQADVNNGAIVLKDLFQIDSNYRTLNKTSTYDLEILNAKELTVTNQDEEQENIEIPSEIKINKNISQTEWNNLFRRAENFYKNPTSDNYKAQNIDSLSLAIWFKSTTDDKKKKEMLTKICGVGPVTGNKAKLLTIYYYNTLNTEVVNSSLRPLLVKFTNDMACTLTQDEMETVRSVFEDITDKLIGQNIQQFEEAEPSTEQHTFNINDIKDPLEDDTKIQQQEEQPIEPIDNPIEQQQEQQKLEQEQQEIQEQPEQQQELEQQQQEDDKDKKQEQQPIEPISDNPIEQQQEQQEQQEIQEQPEQQQEQQQQQENDKDKKPQDKLTKAEIQRQIAELVKKEPKLKAFDYAIAFIIPVGGIIRLIVKFVSKKRVQSKIRVLELKLQDIDKKTPTAGAGKDKNVKQDPQLQEQINKEQKPIQYNTSYTTKDAFRQSEHKI